MAVEIRAGTKGSHTVERGTHREHDNVWIPSARWSAECGKELERGNRAEHNSMTGVSVVV